jgi:hypothetical protein
MEKTIEANACVGHHFDLSNLKFSTASVMLPELFATEIIAYQRSREAFIGDQAVLNRVTEVYELFAKSHENAEGGSVAPAVSSGCTLKARNAKGNQLPVEPAALKCFLRTLAWAAVQGY